MKASLKYLSYAVPIKGLALYTLISSSGWALNLFTFLTVYFALATFAASALIFVATVFDFHKTDETREIAQKYQKDLLETQVLKKIDSVVTVGLALWFAAKGLFLIAALMILPEFCSLHSRKTILSMAEDLRNDK